MTGIFAAWQPRYAAHRIPTFPVHITGADKRPAVANWLKLGLPYSGQLALKFPDNDAFGFCPGARSRITIVDVDTTSERVRDQAFERFGRPRIVVRTLRGHWQGWYRHNGEPRRIKPWPGQPIDLLGSGFVCAPPSRGPAGASYEFVEGTLDDLADLAELHNLPRPAPPANGASRIREGARSVQLWRHCMRAAPHCDDLDQLIDCATTWAADNLDLAGTTHPFTAAEIERAARSAWQYEITDRNWFGRDGVAVVNHADVDRLPPDAGWLLIKLRRHHWGRQFTLTNGMAVSLGWGLVKFRAARDVLVREGFLLCVSTGGRGPGDAPIFRLAP